MKKVMIIFMYYVFVFVVYFLLFYGCGLPSEPTTANESIIVLDSPTFQITPVGTFSTKLNDSTYYINITKELRVFERIEARFLNNYSGAKCKWTAEHDTKIYYSYFGNTEELPILNTSSYFLDNMTSTVVSFYKQFDNDTIVVAGGVLSENNQFFYIDLLYFIVKVNN